MGKKEVVVQKVGGQRVQVHLEGLAASMTGRDNLEVDLPPAVSARELIDHIVKQHNISLADLLFTARGDLRGMARIRIDGRDISQWGGLDAPLEGLSQVTVAVSFAPMMGG